MKIFEQKELSISKLLESSASEEAKKQGLTHKGYGKWADKHGTIVAQTKGDKLIPVKNTGQHIPSSAGNITKTTGPKASKKFISKTKSTFDPLLKTNNVKYGEYVILKNGNRYRKEMDGSFRNMNDPKDIKFTKNLDVDSPISHSETPEGNKKQAQRYDIDKEYNWSQKVKKSNIGDIIQNKKGQQFKITTIGGRNFAKPYNKYQQSIDAEREKEKINSPKKDDKYSDGNMKGFKKQEADIHIGIKKEDSDSQKYKLNVSHIESLNNQANELIKAGKKKEGVLVSEITKNISRYDNYISKKQAKFLHSLGAKLNWK